MVKKRSDTSRSVVPPRIDNLQLINGVGPAVERRLHDRGIFTFAQFAALSPADIAAAVEGISGLTTESITKKDWIGQARKLASESISSEVHEEVEAPAEPIVPPVVSQVELAASSAEVKKPVPPVGAPPGAKEAQTTPPVMSMKGPVGVLHLREMKTASANNLAPQGFLFHSQPFDVRLTLDLSEVVAPEGTQLSYKVSIYGNSLEGYPRQVVGEVSGIITPADSVTVNVKGTTPPKGIYRLQAVVTVAPTTIEPGPGAGLMATMEGNPLMII